MPRLVQAVVVALIVAGLALAYAGNHTLRWSPPPAPPKWAGRDHHPPRPAGWEADRPADQPDPADAARHGYQVEPMSSSAPVSISIPSIKVRAKVIGLGLTKGGAVQVPPLAHPFLTSWYDRGTTPGAPGAAVLFGHVDSAAVGPAVFYNLGELRPGDLIYVTLKDKRTGVFKVYSAALYQKATFPALAIYSYTSWPSLRLITCGGAFDTATGHYLGNTVVFAQYVGQRAGSAP
ncbi:MAG TPA: class F sortase [Streptosporangiaceae bacterium]|nr:class F sortase [Streptosporangiaceae bacterium]